MKKGKKTEDSFDREFNNVAHLQARPERRRSRKKSGLVLADFGDERNIRGNFMVVVEWKCSREKPIIQELGEGQGEQIGW